EKRNIDATELFSEVLRLDEERRSTQATLDEILAESNKLSREIPLMFKSGEHMKADLLKEKSAGLKVRSKELSQKLNQVIADLQQQLYNLPNIPNELVPPGASEE